MAKMSSRTDITTSASAFDLLTKTPSSGVVLLLLVVLSTFCNSVKCQTLNGTVTPNGLVDVASKGGNNGDSDGQDGGVGMDDDLKLNRFVFNVSMFNNDDSNEYEPSLVLMLENVTHACLQRCMVEESRFLNDFGLKCRVGDNRPECYRARCFKGCEVWWHALKEFEPCQEACSSTQFYPFDLPCISGCEATQRHYWHLQRLHVERLLSAATIRLQPQLLQHDNETLNTLTLKWPITVATPTAASLLPTLDLASRPFNIQYQYVLKASPAITTTTTTTTITARAITTSSTTSLTVNGTQDINKGQQQSKHQPDGEEEEQEEEEEDVAWKQQGVHDQWWNLADYNCNENFECDIMDGLMPYTSYKFRFELPFGDSLDDMVYSPPSDVYTTPAMGRPISKPTIKQTLALDDTHLAIFWQPGKFTNGPLTHYRLTLQPTDSNGHKIEKLLTPDVMQYVFANLSASTVYTLRLSMHNQEGEGPFAEVNVTTPPFQKSPLKLDDLNTLIVAGEYSIVMKSLDPLVESRILFKSEHILMDFDVHQYTKQLFVVNKKGSIVSLFVDDPTNYTVWSLNEQLAEGFVASKLAVDWLNQKLYMAGGIRQMSVMQTTASREWRLMRSDLNGSALETVTAAVKPLQHLQVDPLNGWIFATDDQSHLWRMDLSTLQWLKIPLAVPVELFSNKHQNYLLTAFNARDRNVYELSYEGRYWERLPMEISGSFQGDILWYQQYQDWLIASNGSHLLRQQTHTSELDILSFREIEWCWKIVPLMSGSLKGIVQPTPQPLKQPENLQAILSDNKARITWQAPVLVTVFQSLAAWQSWEYELDILDVASNNAFNIRSIKTSHFQVERLQANNLYQMKVRALYAGLARHGMSSTTSEWSDVLTTRTWPVGKHQFLWAASNGLRVSEDILQTAELKALPNVNIKSFTQVNSSLYYVEKSKRVLKCVNVMNGEIPCGFQAHHVYSVDYDWRGGKLYWSDVLKNCVIRSDLKGTAQELLPIFEARLIKLDAARGHVYYTTSSRLMRKALNGIVADQELVYYHVHGNGETILGFALDLSAAHIYWLVQHQEGMVRLLRSITDSVQIEILHDLPEQQNVLLDSFNYLAEVDSFVWLSQADRGREVILASRENTQQLTRIAAPFAGQINFVEVRGDLINYRDMDVVPDPVDRDTVHITEGYWDDFNIKWAPVNRNDNFSIFYRVLISSVQQGSPYVLTFEVNQPIVRITEFKMAGHFINVTITPCTLWSMGTAISVQLRTPSAAPKQPKNLRVFVEQIMEPLRNHSNITVLVRWDSPDNISSEKEVFYKVYCWLKEELYAVKDIEDLGLKSHEVRFHNLQKEESYMFQVQAFSLSRSKGGEKTSLLTHFINPEAQAIPKLMFTTSEYIAELDLDLNTTKQWVYTSSEVEHLALINGEQRLVWVNENVELMSYQPGSASLKLARMRAEVLALTVDWILRKVYWAELSGEVEHSVDIYELDLNHYEGKVMLGSKIFSLPQGKLLKNLIVLPYSRSLLWLEYDVSPLNCTLQGKNLSDFSAIKFKSHHFYANNFEGSLLPEMESVNLVDSKGRLFAYELQRQLTTVLKIPFQVAESFTQFERDSGYIYTLNNGTIKAFNRRKHNLEYARTLAEVKLIRAFNFQEYPKRECLIIEYNGVMGEFNSLQDLFIQEVGESYLVLHLMRKNPFENCKLPIPGLRYKIIINGTHQTEKQYWQQEPGFLNVTELKPYTNYTLEIRSTSYYQQKFLAHEMQYPIFTVRTQEGHPSQPQNFSVKALSPTEISVTWSDPQDLNAATVFYELYWQAQNSSLTSHKPVTTDYEVHLINLEPSQEYLIWLLVFSKPSKLNSSERVLVKTFPEPEQLQLIDRSAYNLTLLWLPNTLYDTVILECQPLTQDPDDTPFSINITGITDNVTVTNLEPKTKYEFYLKLQFAGVNRVYMWPELPSSHYVYETLGDAPGRPGQPQIEHITGEIFKVFWEPAKTNGAPIIEYSLEALKARQTHRRIRRNVVTPQLTGLSNVSSITTLAQLPWVEELQPLEDKWFAYCNTTELSCIVRELHTMRLLMFRVRARNDPYGWGPYSEDSERVLEPFVSPQKRNSLVLAIIAPAAIVTTCVIVLFVIRKVQKRRLKAKQLLEKSRPSIWSNLSTVQQQLASRHRTFSLTSASTMYTGGPLSDADIALLPHINWSQITLLNFLGSGAFGEVYEGMLKHDDRNELEKVAIKSLRKGASEFAELLQEAQLMSNFKHDNIVRLIGVCCDTESISIIMEHMEGGDLLSYLRESRPNAVKPVASLQLLDLMTMCIDVATGMAYLEDMHFVHRDLACRNCLVSSRVPSKRTVKIGDFGLARDIYKSDYYRKEGEALMPVRWMAPESLVDGVFTTQSDVWAFGVLCWEILTLGQQPYAARNNFEVLNFVKDGGRLEQPVNCPDKLFNLMMECWHTDPEKRPTFRKCFNILLSIKTDVRRVSLGYNIDDSDYAMYANQHGIIVSGFLAAGTPLDSVNEAVEDEEEEEEEETKEELKAHALNNGREFPLDKIDLKVRFNNHITAKDVEASVSLDDESHLIDTKLYRVQENPDYYVNEGVSRL